MNPMLKVAKWHQICKSPKGMLHFFAVNLQEDMIKLTIVRALWKPVLNFWSIKYIYIYITVIDRT